MRLQNHQLKADLAQMKAGIPPDQRVIPPRIQKKPRSQEESLMQRALIRWWSANCSKFGVPEQLLFSIPNGGHRSAVTGAIMKLEGARRGVPDLMLAVARAQPHEKFPAIFEPVFGLFLELKRRDGVLSPEQKAFHIILKQQCYRVVVCWSLQECIDTITAYLST